MNSVAALLFSAVTMICSFYVRAVLARVLESDYVGLEGFFANVIGVFSLTELGFSTAIAYCLYKPVHDNEDGTVSAIMHYFKKIYFAVGGVIGVLSILFSFVIQFFFKGEVITPGYLRCAFLIYSMGVSLSYFWAYNRTLVYVTQKNYIVLLIDIVVKFVSSIITVYILYHSRNYLLYLVIVSIARIVSNFFITLFVKYRIRMVSNPEDISDELKKEIKIQVKSLAVTNACYLGVASTDNIIIASILGSLELAKNSGYSALIQAGMSIVNSGLRGASASIGDLIAEGNTNKTRKYFERYVFLYNYTASLCAVGFCILSNSVIEIWLGKIYVFDTMVIIAISSALYIQLLYQPLGEFINLGGLFSEYRRYAIGGPILNLVLSVFLSFSLGISGVFIGTVITYLYMCIVMLSILSHRLIYLSVKKYVFLQIRSLIHTISVIGIMNFCYLNINSMICDIIIKFILIVLIHTMVAILLYCRDEDYRYFISLIKSYIFKRRRISNDSN